ncbi:hypothetical protein PPGU19_093080 (plasmid) [Paraburkholderia sp. PGU19]|nr:hypothetical protein PPGU19_093080 [Paraburkholderia sp. PGU19]
MPTVPEITTPGWIISFAVHDTVVEPFADASFCTTLHLPKVTVDLFVDLMLELMMDGV